MFDQLKKNLLVRLLAAALASLLFALLVHGFHFDYYDALFLDLKQFVFQARVNDPEVVYLDLSSTDLRDEKGVSIPAKFIEAIDLIHSKKPKKIILATSFFDFPSEQEAANIQKYTLKYPELIWYADWDGKSLLFDFKNGFLVKESPDIKLGGRDAKYRRIFLSKDCVDYDEDFLAMLKSFGLSVKGLHDFDGIYYLFESCQLLYKHYDRKSYARVKIEDLRSTNIDLTGKIIFTGAIGTYHVSHGSMDIFSRFHFFDFMSLNEYLPGGENLINYYENLKKNDYIRSPSILVNSVWIFLVVFILFSFLILAETRTYIIFAGLYWLLVPAMNLLIFKATNLNLDLSRAFLGMLMLEFISIPVLILKYLRKLDAEAVEREKALERERFKTKFIVKAARADLNMKLAARVSHDIRSPLMALQVASAVLKGKIAGDVETLMGDSVARLKFIADDVLKSYRGGDKAADGGIEWIDLLEQSRELLQSYISVHRQVEFINEIPAGFSVYIPRYVFQRSLANLLNNGIEAAGERARIRLSVAETEHQVFLRIADNGPGIAPEIRAKLFKERATFGKQQGTGLGLFQVRRDLSVYGAQVRLQDSSDIANKEPKAGATFEMVFPKSLSKIPFEISERVLVVEAERGMIDLFAQVPPSVKVQTCASVSGALECLRQSLAGASPPPQWTLFVDMVLTEEETGFDLIENIPAAVQCKIILCSSFADNEEVQQLAMKYRTLLVTKATLYQLDWKVHGD